MNTSLFSRKYSALEIKDIVVCGVQRSGSTLLFNMVNEVVHSKPQLLDTYFENERDYRKILQQERSTLVKKNHVYVPLLAKRVKQKISYGFFTHRDIRDIIVSFIQLGWLKEVDDWIKNYNIKNMMYNSILYASTPNMQIIAYEDLVRKPEKVVQYIANTLEIPLTKEQIKQIVEHTSIQQSKKDIGKEVVGQQYPYVSQYIDKHIADGKIDKWRTFLSSEDQQKLNEYCAEYLDFFGYSKN
ncbi:sulfotransferase domain-containing protein [Porifericola rhodea]|uniref:sulfotransferase domain-containing protein n=1 Tax=Porifericola rhodea TaxID=930972 RepID=UPI002666CE10|nr:sulfotransferase domain-containing protein [Porifericola rhodea]WKN31575.1 sulfotransferase domain-containing protein [Porifericola rhodea]